MTLNESIKEAEDLLEKNEYMAAARIYLSLMAYEEVAPFCDYRLATISNNMGNPLIAYDHYYRAFAGKPNIASIMYGSDHSSSNYIFEGKKDEMELTNCPICGTSEVQPKWCYVLAEATGYNSFFNPIRLWMYCKQCHHVFARYFPEKLFLHNDKPRTTDPAFFSYYSHILNRISQFTLGGALLEVGIGACECMLSAQEIGYDTFGIDVIEKHVSMAREKYGLNVETADFVTFETDKKFDVIVMGDVIEHVSDPIIAMNNAYKLLNDNGAIWVSTPNFDSAYSVVSGHNDIMRRQQYHLNYFSRDSFYKLLDKCGFAPVEYTISSHYKGSMEIIAIKKSRINT